MAEYVNIGFANITQTLIASSIGTISFLVLIGIYLLLRKNENSKFANAIDMAVESMMTFFYEVGETIPFSVIKIVVFVFFYLLWTNFIGLIGDIAALSVPALHHYFRPASTDVSFNLILAGTMVVMSIAYGFSKNGVHYIEKYIPYKGIGIVPKVTNIPTAIAKIGDIVVGLLIGIIELIGELAKTLSLSLRLFGNILAGVVLLTLMVSASTYILHAPVVLPIIVEAYELAVGFLQAFVFALLVLVYFKVAGTSHH